MYLDKKPNQEVLGMARVGFTPDRYEVYVNTNDGGKIPHFHYRDANDWNKFHTYIKIDKPEYFAHEGKEDKLNARQLRSLYRFLKSGVTISKYKDKFKTTMSLPVSYGT